MRPTVRRIREAGDDLLALARLAAEVGRYYHTRVTVESARARVRRRLERRADRLLELVERTIYGQATSPYLALLRHVGCEPGDFRALLGREGVEGALRVLADRGVYLTYDELKGRRPIVRGSLRVDGRPDLFDNPRVRPHLILRTSGSGGSPGRVRYSLAYFVEQAETIALVLDAHGVRRPRLAYWLPAPVHHLIISGMLGQPASAWFYPVHPLPTPARLVGHFLALVGRASGCSFPSPRRCDLGAPEALVAWLGGELREGRPLVLFTMPGAGARLAAAAAGAGLDLRGLVLMIAGEPVTWARRRQAEATGARVAVAYGSVELSGLSYSCATPTAADDVHVMVDRFAVVPRRRPIAAGGPDVDALLITSLSAWTPKIALNAELGDYAELEDRACGCALGALGLRTHLSGIRSFEKLTGEGVTFARADLQQILDDVLPSRFGGTSLDYQLAEEEAPGGATRVVLRVSPAVGEVDEAALREAVLVEIGRGGLVDAYHAGIWRGASTIEVRREAPLATQAGKVLPFQALSRAESARPP